MDTADNRDASPPSDVATRIGKLLYVAILVKTE